MDKTTKKNLIASILVASVLIVVVTVSVYAWFMDKTARVRLTEVHSTNIGITVVENLNASNIDNSGYGTVSYIATSTKDTSYTFTLYLKVAKVDETGSDAVDGKPTLANNLTAKATGLTDATKVTLTTEYIEIGKITLSAGQSKDFTVEYRLKDTAEQIYLHGDKVRVEMIAS
ncbi:MAG: hypothetical protein J6V68_03165 [Clostridia bacterium]|nr:hypothetical protein [Clostridia bacterium]